MKISFHTNAPENHASRLDVAAALVGSLSLALTSRLATLLSLVVIIILTPGGVR